MLQFCILFYANYTTLATQRGSHGPIAPLNTPLGGPGRYYYLLSSILFIANYCCTRVLLYDKMLKETENEETRLFCQTFVISGVSIVRARAPWAIPLAMPMILK